MPKRAFGYSARALFGKDHIRSDRTILDDDDDDFQQPKRNEAELSDGIKKVLRYICILLEASGKQFDNILGRLHWILKTSGSVLEQEDSDSLDEAFDTLRDMVLNKNHSHSSRWKIMELIELRANEWEDADTITSYYEDPANFMLPISPHAAFSNNNLPGYHTEGTTPRDLSPELRRPLHPRMGSLQSKTSPPTESPRTRAPSAGSLERNTPSDGSLRSRTPSGGSLRSRTPSGGSLQRRTPSDGSVRSRTPSGGSLRKRTPSHGSLVLSRKSSVGDVFNGADSDSSDDSVVTTSSSSSVSAAQYRLLQVNSGKPIKYTQKFLLECWGSPLCKIMPSVLQHTIMNSDIAYIIKGPPFEDPVELLEHCVDDSVFPLKRSTSLPLDPSRGLSSPDAEEPRPGPVRSQSVQEPYKFGGAVYYDIPTEFHEEHTPILEKETFRKLFKDAMEQIHQ